MAILNLFGNSLSFCLATAPLLALPSGKYSPASYYYHMQLGKSDFLARNPLREMSVCLCNFSSSFARIYSTILLHCFSDVLPNFISACWICSLRKSNSSCLTQLEIEFLLYHLHCLTRVCVVLRKIVLLVLLNNEFLPFCLWATHSILALLLCENFKSEILL